MPKQKTQSYAARPSSEIGRRSDFVRQQRRQGRGSEGDSDEPVLVVVVAVVFCGGVKRRTFGGVDGRGLGGSREENAGGGGGGKGSRAIR